MKPIIRKANEAKQLMTELEATVTRLEKVTMGAQRVLNSALEGEDALAIGTALLAYRRAAAEGTKARASVSKLRAERDILLSEAVYTVCQEAGLDLPDHVRAMRNPRPPVHFSDYEQDESK